MCDFAVLKSKLKKLQAKDDGLISELEFIDQQLISNPRSSLISSFGRAEPKAEPGSAGYSEEDQGEGPEL